MIQSMMISEDILKDYQVFDIRNKSEWRESGVIEGAVLLNFNLSNGSPNPDFIKEFQRLRDENKTQALVCASGFRSASATNLIKAKLNIDVINLKGGMHALFDQGYKSVPYRGQDLV